ncbi:uncharacterized protein K441DRAFT_486574, partial [Cenococcum geophilum 1.58]|uniref:uncharacterized protein n=1 Tax=Cenococcum geophilum 1.58 TaxID=794803 RepID=UPI00358E6630
WNAHKATIRSLYLDENRKLTDVMRIMATEHKFSATKAQYEKHFKLWGSRKNKTKDVWETIALKVTKRKRENRESEIIID